MAMFVKSDGRALWPANKAAHIQLEKLARGVPMRVEPKQPRNGKFHDLSFQLFTMIAEALNNGPTPVPWTQERVLRIAKIATGHVEVVELPPDLQEKMGEKYAVVPLSISYAAMDERQFQVFMEGAFAYFRNKLCPWIMDSPQWPDIKAILYETARLEQAA